MPWGSHKSTGWKLSVPWTNGKIKVGALKEFIQILEQAGFSDSDDVCGKTGILDGTIRETYVEGIPSNTSAAKETLLPRPEGPPTAALPTVPLSPVPPVP